MPGSFQAVAIPIKLSAGPQRGKGEEDEVGGRERTGGLGRWIRWGWGRLLQNKACCMLIELLLRPMGSDIEMCYFKLWLFHLFFTSGAEHAQENPSLDTSMKDQWLRVYFLRLQYAVAFHHEQYLSPSLKCGLNPGPLQKWPLKCESAHIIKEMSGMCLIDYTHGRYIFIYNIYLCCVL